MLTRTPLAGAVLSVFCLPLATPALAQSTPPSVTAPAPAAASGAQAAPRSDGALPAVNVNAQAPTRATEFKPERSTIGGKTPTALRDIPQSVTVVNRAVFESQGATSLQDALRNVPGITIGAAEGGSIGNNINLRGFTARTDIYLDGFRDRGQYYRDTFDLDAIEVLYGPSSMLFGRGSTGGVINQVSKQATLKQAAEVSTTVGTDDHYRTSIDVDQPLSNTAALRLNAFGQSIHSTRDVESQKDYGIAPTLRLGIGTPTQITLSALIQHNRDMADYGVPPLNGAPAPVSRNTFYGLTTDRTIQDVQQFSATIEHRFSPNLTLRNQSSIAHYAIDAIESAPGTVLLPDGTVLANGNFTNVPASSLRVQLAPHDRVINDHSLYNDTQLVSKFVTGPFAHELISGIELGRETYTNQSLTATGLPIVSLIDPIYQAQPSNVTITPGNLAQATANSFAAYFNDSISIGEHWKVVGGLRWDRFQAEINNTTSLPGSAAQTNYFTSVRSGVIYQPTDWQSYYLSYGTSFNPSLEQLTVTNFTQNLPPESSRSYEVGAKWDLLDGRLSATSSLFQVEKTNARTQVSPNEFELDGDVRVNGFQSGVTGRLTNQWQVFAGYTFMDAKIVQASDGTQGNTPANTPRNTATLWTTYQFTPAWQAGGGLTYMSSRYAANTDLVQVGGYTRWDATVAYHRPRYDIRLNLLNLTNKAYYDALIQSDGGRSVPGIGRTLLATFTYRL